MKVEIRPKERENERNPVSTNRKDQHLYGHTGLPSRWQVEFRREGFFQGSSVVFRKKSGIL
jgi:hypothetical protein